LQRYNSAHKRNVTDKQESCDIAKMTARYALDMGALKVFECA